MNVKITVSFSATMTLLKFADSLMPTMRRIVMMATTNIAGIFKIAPVLVQPCANNCQMFHQCKPACAV